MIRTVQSCTLRAGRRRLIHTGVGRQHRGVGRSGGALQTNTPATCSVRHESRPGKFPGCRYTSCIFARACQGIVPPLDPMTAQGDNPPEAEAAAHAYAATGWHDEAGARSTGRSSAPHSLQAGHGMEAPSERIRTREDDPTSLQSPENVPKTSH